MPKKNQTTLIGHLLNILWSIICFTPIVVYWADFGAQKWLYVFIFSGVVTMFMPKQVLYKLSLRSSRTSYENWGVKTFRKFVQEGDHRWATKMETKYIANRTDAKKYLGKIDMYERFHWCCLVFFLFSGVHGFAYGKVAYGMLITAANAIYNLPTILLQQYNRLRIEALLKINGK